MTIQRLLASLAGSLLLCVLFTLTAFAQTKTITGKITDDKGAPIQGATVSARGTKAGASTGADGTYRITVPSSARTLVISSVGFSSQDITIGAQESINVSMVPSTTNLNEVVVIGYGTARRKDLSGSFAAISPKNFNQGVPAATPDQLLQGKVAGMEVVVASGQPGAPTVVKIRGNNSIRANTNPLYVIDGVPLDGRSARPNFLSGPPGQPDLKVSGVGNMPDANPLTFLNSADIENITVLKDASASAIYGSRGANGVILITTRSGSSGPVKIDGGAAWSIGGLMKQPDVLDVSQYKAALAKYGAASDSGASYKPFNEIIQHKLTQNYSIALSGGGNENNRYRASFLASSTPGIVRKTGLDRYVGNFNASYKLLDKKLTISFGATTANTNEQIAPISSNAGSTGSVISNALQWNPTLVMKRGALGYTTNPNGQVNPLAFSDGYNDYANVTTVLGNFTAGYKIFPFLEYKFLYGVNYSTGVRKSELPGWVSGTGGNNVPDAKTGLGGEAAVAGTQMFSQTITHTLTYNQTFNDNFTVTGLAGYEYWTTSYKSQYSLVYGFDVNNSLNKLQPIHLYDIMQDGLQKNLLSYTFNDPRVELQSYFTRWQFNYKDRYSLSASFRADGSSKFGSNHRYAYFPAFSAKWSISEEDFMKNNTIFSNLGLRVGWGKTGNQEFPAGAADSRYQYNGSNNLNIINFANPKLKWETITAYNAGIDFGFLKGRITGAFEVFFKKTTDPLFPGTFAVPAPAGTLWQNLPGYITNKGGELGINAVIIQKDNFSWSVGGNVTYVKNKFVYPAAGKAPLVLAGQLSGKGTSATYVQAIANDQPIDVFFLRKFKGFDQNGFAITDSVTTYSGDPNPHYIVGLNTELDYKRFSLVINLHGAYDYVIYNNTLQSVTGLSFIVNGSNISKTLIGTKENLANPVSSSTRYLYSGNYMKLGNATLRYRVGDLLKYLKNVNVTFTGYNLFNITHYPGFDPEVNVSTADINTTGIPSRGIDYIGYPTVRSFTLGVNFSLY